MCWARKWGVNDRGQICGFQYQGMSLALTTGRAGSPGVRAVFSHHLRVCAVSPAQQMLEHRKLPRISVGPDQDRIPSCFLNS